MLKLLSIVRDFGACSHIRMRQIVKEIKRKELARVFEVDATHPQWEAEDITEEGVKKANLIWIGRSVSKNIIGLTKIAQDNGIKVLFDLDDFVLDVSPWSAHYDVLGTEEFNYNGRPMWKDKVNIDLKQNRKRRSEFIEYLKVVGALSVTTPRLMECYKPYANKIYVFPNTVDMKKWDYGMSVKKNPNKVKIFWQGGISHYEDFWEIADVIPEITKKYPQVHWVNMGAAWEFFWNKIPKERHEYIDWAFSEAYPYVMKLVGADIGIAPLRDTKFNRCKSSIKFYEYSALGMPTVASNVPPYCDDMVDGKNGFLASSPKEWMEKLSILIEDSIVRNRLAGAAYKYVESERSVEVVTPLIVQAMEAYVSGKGLPN